MSLASPKTPGVSRGVGLVILLLLGPQLLTAHAQKLVLEFEPEWQGHAVLMGRTPAAPKATNLSISRLDGLLSQLALQDVDGRWVESADWHAFLSAERRLLTAVAEGLPPREFKAIRFNVGVEPSIDAGDPNQWPANHPLHPDRCGLHWGWNSGYVFLAIEGHWEPAGGQTRGFSYHLAGAATPMRVELPVRFSGARATTILFGMDLAAILDQGAALRDATSTHSRAGDEFASVLKARVARSFRVKSVSSDTYQPIPASSASSVARGVKGTAPYRLNISDRLPQVQWPEDNPLTVEGVELGRQLFHEPRLSRHERLACATCHDRARAFSDGRASSLGDSGEPVRRNAMPLSNLAWARDFFWDGRARSLREQVLLPIQDAHEMNETLDRIVKKITNDPAYPPRFRAAFGTPGITAGRIALALEQFLLTLVSQESKFDRAARKLVTLTSLEQRGLQLFVTEHDPARGLRGADCFHCHGGNLFSNHQFLNNGLEERAGDTGRMEVTGSTTDRGKFKVPSLRNVALTAPYMHDGRFATLEEVVDHYNGPMARSGTLDPNLAKHPESGLGLSAEDKAALIAFLRTLTDEILPTRQNP